MMRVDRHIEQLFDVYRDDAHPTCYDIEQQTNDKRRTYHAISHRCFEFTDLNRSL